MKIDDIEKIVIDCLRQNIEMSGEDSSIAITRETVPMDDIDGFDSLRAMEILVEIEGALGKELTAKDIYQTRQDKPQTIADIAMAIIKNIGGKHD